jgi:ribosomal protein L40E
MDDSPRKTQWWLIITAAVLAVLTLYYYTGSWEIVVLFFAAFGAFVFYQATRARRPPSYECVRCGAKLNPNARQCNACGSAGWRTRN